MANTGNILDSHGKKKIESLTGSTFILGSNSYSGADIKVVVHSYDNGKQMVNQLNDIVKDREDAEKRLEEVKSAISTARANIIIFKPGTPEAYTEQRKINILLSQEVRINDMIISLTDTIKERMYNIYNNENQISTQVLADIQTLSVSILRDKQAVRSLGSVYPKSFIRDQREIAGTLVFTVFDKHVLYNFLSSHLADVDHAAGISSVLLDQLPPVDITIAFANEYGSVSRMALLGVEFVDEGQVMSIEDIITENTVSFVARDIDPMRSVKKRKIDEHSRLLQGFSAKKASDLILEDDYQKVKGMISPFKTFKRRRNPYI